MNILNWSEQKIKKFSIWDFAIFKVYIFSIGIIVGAYFYQFVQNNVVIIALIAVFTLAWLMNAMFNKHKAKS